MLLATNSSFRTVENKQFRKMLKPGTTPPDRKVCAGSLLNEVFDFEFCKVKNSVKGLVGTMAIDEWSTLTNDPVFGVCVYYGGKCYLTKTNDTSGESHTTEYLTDITVDQIRDIESNLEVEITSVVSDNASNMASMRTALKAKQSAYISDTDVNCVADVTKFMACHEPFSNELFGESFIGVQPGTWWASGKKLGFNSNLIEVATSITTCFASSGGLKRQFSTLGINYGKLRSISEVQKAGRIAFLYRHLNDE